MGFLDMIPSLFLAAQELLRRVFSAEHREKLVNFLAADPLMASLIATIAVFVSVPALFFAAYITAVFSIHLGTALLSFAFWSTSGLALLLPAVIIASVLAVCVWFWGVLGFFAVGWFLRLSGHYPAAVKEVPVEVKVEEKEEEEKDEPSSFALGMEFQRQTNWGTGNMEMKEEEEAAPEPEEPEKKFVH